MYWCVIARITNLRNEASCINLNWTNNTTHIKLNNFILSNWKLTPFDHIRWFASTRTAQAKAYTNQTEFHQEFTSWPVYINLNKQVFSTWKPAKNPQHWALNLALRLQVNTILKPRGKNDLKSKICFFILENRQRFATTYESTLIILRNIGHYTLRINRNDMNAHHFVKTSS